MSGLTAKTYTFAEEIVDVIVRKMHGGMLPKGVTPLITNNIKTVTKTFFGPVGYSIVKYSDGWQGGTQANKWEKDFTIGEVKSEKTFSKQNYANSVQAMATDIKNAFQNDITGELKESVTLLGEMQGITGNEEEALMAAAELFLFIDPFVKSAYFLQMLGDTAKITLEGDGSTTKFPNNVTYNKYEEDVRFSSVKGLWAGIMEVAATSPTDQQIQHVAFPNGATAQVCTLTMSGTGGTATVSYKGISAVATFDTSLTLTNTNFVTANAAAWKAVGVTLTASSADLIFTEDQLGITVADATGVNLTLTLAGSNATTAATAASALTNGDCEAQMQAAWAARPAIMRNIPKKDLVWLVTSDLYDNYENTLQGNGTIVVESQRSANMLGVPPDQMKQNGIEVFEMPIDEMIESYFGGHAPSRILLIPRWNLAPVYSSVNQTADMAVEWNLKDNANLGRIQAAFGMDTWEPRYCVAVY